MDLKYKLIEGILYMVKQERENSTQSNRDIISKLVHILLALQLYKGEFEERLIEQTKEFYQKKQLTLEENLATYMIMVEDILLKESDMIKECLDVCSLDKITECVKDILIS